MGLAFDTDDDPPVAGDAGEDAGGDAGDDDWSFDAADLEPATDTLGESLDPEDLARLEQQRREDSEREEAEREERQQLLDEQGRQRRQNVRVDVRYPMVLHQEGYPDSPGRTRDMSATGVGFSTRVPLEVGAIAEVTIEFPEWSFTKPLEVRFAKPILAGRQVGGQFVELTSDERERMVKEVFAVQRDQLQGSGGGGR